MKILKNIVKKAIKLDKRVNNKVTDIIKNNDLSPINKTEDHDIFVAGFPKSGNTWVQNLVTGILLDSISYRITPKLVSEIVPDVHAKQFYKRIFPVMVFKTHDLPNIKYKRVIHLVRDGRDAMLSYYKMEVNRDKSFKYSLADMIKEGKGVYPAKWYMHTNLWLENKYNAELITLKYEDLLNRPLKAMKKLSDFLKVEITEERLDAIYKANHINILRQKVSDYGWDYDYIYKNKTSQSFFRKGTTGSYRNEMNEDLVTFFENESKKELQHFNYI